MRCHWRLFAIGNVTLLLARQCRQNQANCVCVSVWRVQSVFITSTRFICSVNGRMQSGLACRFSDWQLCRHCQPLGKWPPCSGSNEKLQSSIKFRYVVLIIVANALRTQASHLCVTCLLDECVHRTAGCLSGDMALRMATDRQGAWSCLLFLRIAFERKFLLTICNFGDHPCCKPFCVVSNDQWAQPFAQCWSSSLAKFIKSKKQFVVGLVALHINWLADINLHGLLA